MLAAPDELLERAARRQAPKQPAPDGCLISVIIPAHNEDGYLGETLAALQCQTYRRFEVVVVANGCQDKTVAVARGRCDRLVAVSRKNLGRARNLGARLARGALLVFLDADTLLEPAALARMAAAFSQTAAAGTVKGRPDKSRLAYRLIYALKNSVHRWGLHPGSSGVMLCWKEQFMRCGGFDEGLEVRENSELLRRLMQFGSYKYLGDITATTSMRRYEQRGVGRVTWLWCRLWFQSLLGDLHQKHYEPVR
jgi:glycosyltransferase involved in cell wall biosynthesis